MKYEFKKHLYRTPDKLCELFFCVPFPEFYPPQLPGTKIIIIEDLPVRRVKDAIIFGRIADCETDEPIVGAIVKVFYTNEEEELIDLFHTISGCDGYYMLRIPEEYEGKTVTIMTTCSNCSDTIEPCECP
ncbi:MAG: hypothetical protein RIN55_10835 [Tissierellaceae bacterium]|nr:hypothetical protein [Tissierellaceae bacterium]